MYRKTLAVFIFVTAVATRAAFAQSMSASPVPLSSPAPAAPGAVASVDPGVTARAQEWLHRAQTGTIDRAQLTAQMNTLLTDDLVKQVATRLGPLGNPTDFSLVDMRSVAGSNVYMYRAQFKSGPLDEILSVDATGKINGLRFLPAQ